MRPIFFLAYFILACFSTSTIANDLQLKLPSGYELQTYNLPAGSGPHDVAPAPNGLVWYTAQKAAALGILDPETGKITEVDLGEGSRPHGVIQGPQGNAWITDSGLNAIVKYAPDTGNILTWPLPAEIGYANLNTATFDNNGKLWFTGQSGFYGSLDPSTDTLNVYEAPRKAGPYGIATTPTGLVFYASLAGNYLGKIDTQTGSAEIIEPPTKDQGARRVWSDSSNNIWVSEWNSGQLSRYTPSSGQWQSWKLPGGNGKAYAVYVDENDMVWVSDFIANATWIFDSTTNQFVGSVKGSAPNANVRQILGRTNEVWLPESGIDRLMVVRKHTGT